MGFLTTYNGSLEQLAKKAGVQFLYDARKDLITANGVTPDRSGKGNNVTWANYAGTSVSGLVMEWVQKLVNGQYKSEVSYNPATWAEWSKYGGSITFGPDGVEMTANGGYMGFSISTNLKVSTKYGYLINIVHNDFTIGHSVYLDGWDRPQTNDWDLANKIGNQKFIDTTDASFNSNKLEFGTNSTVGEKINIRDIRVFELPAGSQIETDFTNMTADQLAAKYPMPSGAVLPFRRSDGNDDYGSLVNTPSVDITSAPLAVFLTLKTSSISNMYLMCKNNIDSTDIQYALLLISGTQLDARLAGANRAGSLANAVISNAWVNVGFIWDGTNVKTYVNQVQSGATGSYNGTLTSQSNLRIGRRETASGHFAGNIATITIYSGAQATEANILKAEKAISKAYLP